MKKTAIIAAALIILFAMALRVNAPRADLPSHITFSGSILTDEGNQCHNSRSKVLYGQWFPDDWRITNYNPVLPWIKYAVFKIFGVGMTQLRLVNYIFAFLSLLFFFLTLRSYFRENPYLALLGTFLLGINFFYVMYNKIGTFETSITFWVVLTLYFIEKYRSALENPTNPNRPFLFLFLSGASAFMAFIFKSIMVYLLPLPFAAVVLVQFFDITPGNRVSFTQHVRKLIKPVLIILAGCLILMVPWYLFHYLPNREWIISAPGQYMGKLMLPGSLDDSIRNFLQFPWKEQFFKIPVVWLGAVLYIPLYIRRMLRRRAGITETGFFLFFMFHTLLFFFLSYRPTRYFVPVIPVMVFLTVLVFQAILRYSSEESTEPLRRFEGSLLFGFLFALDTIWLILAAYFCFLPLLGHIAGGVPRPPLSVFYLPVCAAIVAAAYLTKTYLRNHIFKDRTWPPGNKKIALVAVVIAVITATVFSLGYYLDWNANKTFTIRDISRELDKKLDNAYIGGMTAPAAVLENTHKTLWLYPNFVNWDAETFKKYPLTHVLLGTDVSREIHHFFNTWPQRMERAALLKIYPIKDYSLHLYSFVEPYIRSASFLPASVNATADRNNIEKTCRLVVFNPTKIAKTIQFGLIRFPAGSPPRVLEFGQPVTLSPGENRLDIPCPEGSSAEKMLVFPDRSESSFNPGDKNFTGHRLRYEAENLPSRTGRVIRFTSASNGMVRLSRSGIDRPGFLSYGPAVPFARGYIVAEFHLDFQEKKTRLKPLVDLDIYSHNAQKPIAQLSIKPSDTKKTKTFRLYTLLPEPDTLEFRVKTRGLADVTFDYVDLLYYQGLVLTQMDTD